MKVLLVIDTSGPQQQVALVLDGQVAEKISWTSDRNSRGDLLAEVDKILKAKNIKISQLNRIAVSEGPGHYSALRGGIVAASFLSMAGKSELVGVTPGSLAEMIEEAEKAVPRSIITPQYK